MDYREVKIRSDGKRISTAVFDPNGKEEITKIAVLTPGFLDSKDYPDMVELGKSLSKYGYLAASFDPTGTWKSEGSILDYSATKILQNIKAVAEYLKNQTGNMSRELVVLGHSLGAMVSIIYGSGNSDVSGVVSIMPPQSFIRPENLKAKIKPWQEAGVKKSTRDMPNNPSKIKKFNVPYSFVEDVIQYDAMTAVGLLRVPTLLMAGTLDETITPDHVRPIYEAANHPKELVILDNIGHDYRKSPQDTTTVNNHVLSFLHKHNL